jgi:FHS family glucose/mannose:H+ symporter-like MFS transporter
MGMFNIGMIFGSTGPLVVPIANFFQLTLAETGLPVMANTVGFLLATMVMSFIWKIQKTRLLVTSFSLLFLVSQLAIALYHHNFQVVLALLFLVGFSQGLLHVAFDALISELYSTSRARYLGILHVFVGLGAFFSPLLVGLILAHTGYWYLVYLLMGLANVALPLLFIRKGLYRARTFRHQSHQAKQRSTAGVLSSPLFWVAVLVMLLGMGAQISFTSWLPLFLVRLRGLAPSTASYSVSIFWLTMIGGRLLFSRYLQGVDLTKYLIITIGAAALFVGLAFALPSIPLIIVLVAGAGLFLSIVWPGTLALGTNIFPQQVGFLTGILSASGSAAGVLFPWLIGPVSELLGLGVGVFVVPVLAVAATLILLYGRYLYRSEAA